MSSTPFTAATHIDITFSLMYAYSENFVLPLSHHEVVHLKGSMITNRRRPLAEVRQSACLLWVIRGHPGKKLLFMGAEFCRWTNGNFSESLDWHLIRTNRSDPHHAQLRDFLRDLNRLYQVEPAFNALDADRRLLLDRRASTLTIASFPLCAKVKMPNDTLVFVCNFTPVPRHGYARGGRVL